MKGPYYKCAVVGGGKTKVLAENYSVTVNDGAYVRSAVNTMSFDVKGYQSIVVKNAEVKVGSNLCNSYLKVGDTTVVNLGTGASQGATKTVESVIIDISGIDSIEIKAVAQAQDNSAGYVKATSIIAYK